MIESIILEHLGDMAEPVYMEVPEYPNSSELFNVVELTGRSINDHLESATIAVQSYGPTLYDAAELSERTVKKMLGLIEHPAVFKCALNSCYNFTNTQTKRYRYQSVYNIIYKEF